MGEERPPLFGKSESGFPDIQPLIFALYGVFMWQRGIPYLMESWPELVPSRPAGVGWALLLGLLIIAAAGTLVGIFALVGRGVIMLWEALRPVQRD